MPDLIFATPRCMCFFLKLAAMHFWRSDGQALQDAVGLPDTMSPESSADTGHSLKALSATLPAASLDATDI